MLENRMFPLPLRRGGEAPAGLRLDSREASSKRRLRPRIVPGKSGESLLIQAIRHEDGLAMPPKKPRLSEEIDHTSRNGWTSAAPIAGRVAQPSFSATIQKSPIALGVPAGQEARSTAGPGSRLGSHNPIDAFILSKLEERRWHPSRRRTQPIGSVA